MTVAVDDPLVTTDPASTLVLGRNHRERRAMTTIIDKRERARTIVAEAVNEAYAEHLAVHYRDPEGMAFGIAVDYRYISRPTIEMVLRWTNNDVAEALDAEQAKLWNALWMLCMEFDLDRNTILDRGKKLADGKL